MTTWIVVAVVVVGLGGLIVWAPWSCRHRNAVVKEYRTTAEAHCPECGAHLVRWHGVWM